jgi:hypothetical protein
MTADNSLQARMNDFQPEVLARVKVADIGWPPAADPEPGTVAPKTEKPAAPVTRR